MSFALVLQAAPQLELTSPANNAVLEGGMEASVSWTSTSLPESIEEWEAFLSVDGGRWYSVRITPHLDRSIRSFRWTVPNVAASDARILIRTGNEREELAFHFPQRFTIVPGRAGFTSAGSANETEATGIDEEEGEAALPETRPVIAWVEGSRNGDGLRTIHLREPATIQSRWRLTDQNIVRVAQRSEESPLARPARPEPIVRTRKATIFTSSAVAVRPLFLLATRLNI